MSNVKHSELETVNLHKPGYLSESDPGEVGVGIFWIDTSESNWVLNIRNSENDGWIELIDSGAIANILDGTTPFTALNIENDTTNHALHIQQDGVLASDKNALFITSGAAQVNSALLKVTSTNVDSTYYMAHFQNYGTGIAVNIDQLSNLAGQNPAVNIYSNVAQTNALLLRVYQDNASSTYDVMHLLNDGTGKGLVISQRTALAASKHALHVTSDVAQTTANFMRVDLTHASSTADSLYLSNAGSGSTIYAANSGTGYCFRTSGAYDSADDLAVMRIAGANSGAGDVMAFNFGSGVVDATSGGDTKANRLKVQVEGVTRYIYLYSD